MVVSIDGGGPKSSILIGFSVINQPYRTLESTFQKLDEAGWYPQDLRCYTRNPKIDSEQKNIKNGWSWYGLLIIGHWVIVSLEHFKIALNH